MPLSEEARKRWGEAGRAAWASGDWSAVILDLVDTAVDGGDTALLAAAVEVDARNPESSALAPHVGRIERMPQSTVRDAALAFIALRTGTGERGLAPARAAVEALIGEHPAVAASMSIGAALLLSDRARWGEASAFLDTARSALSVVRESGAGPDERYEQLWFTMMAVAVLVEWNTFAGEAAYVGVSAALAEPRTRNLLLPHHAPALIAVGHVLGGRGEFGAAAVSLARGVRMLPDAPMIRASATASLALVRYRQSNWAEARRAVMSVQTLVAGSDTDWARALGAAVSTLEPALAGDFRTARVRIDATLAAMEGRWSVMTDTLLLHARLALAIGENDWTEMLRLLDAAEEPGYRRAYTDHEWRALRAMALRNTGRGPEYRAALERWQQEPGATQHPYLWAHLALLAQTDGDPSAALRAARRTRELTGDGDDPLGRTWSRIVVGTIVSLYGDPTEGLESYEAARAELIEMGAVGFVRLCTRIIEGTAARVAAAGGDDLGALTAQQRRVAELVAEGYTSAEIGQILYLSKKTIDFHVANIVSRLGLSSRRELKRRLTPQGR